jgi:predicted ATPase
VAKYRHTTLPPPYLKRIWFDASVDHDPESYPYCLPLFRSGVFELSFETPITVIAGENGVGKSTLLEGIAVLAGFDENGGGPGYRAVDNSRAEETGGGELARALKASWLPKIGRGWFFRAESFFSVARYLDEVGSPTADFLSHSHGEGFMRFFEERCCQPGIFFFDEPESALSPTRQFEFLKLLRRMELEGHTQVIMATHSPILMALPGAQLLRMRKYGLDPVELEDTEHYRIYREFILDRRSFVEAMID